MCHKQRNQTGLYIKVEEGMENGNAINGIQFFLPCSVPHFSIHETLLKHGNIGLVSARVKEASEKGAK